MWAVYKREMRSFFISPIGYVFIAVFLAASAAIFSITTLKAMTTNTMTFFTIMIFSLVIIIPLLTMKLFAEERKLKTEQLLMTAPITIPGFVFAKFLAAFTMFLGCLAVMSLNLIPLYLYAEPQTPIIIGCYFALILVGAAFISIGTLVSSFTENQLASAVMTMLILGIFVAISFLNSYIDVYIIRAALDWLSVMVRFQNFMLGQFDFVALVYYASISFIFLFLTVRVYERRRWGS